MSSEIEVEAIPGLPGELPPGEYVIWQGRPQWKAFARETFSLRWLAGYFALFTALRFVASLGERSGLGVMLDDLFAALWSGVAIWAVSTYLPVQDVLDRIKF